jgi:5,10-methylenetetrahydromethanopterin reductase
MQVFVHAFPTPGATAELAAAVEAEGWDGLLLADSQNLQADVFVELALAAKATDRLLVGTGVTNPVTRHPAVVASAAATLQAESGGRMVLGVGRGDSSVTFVGERPAPAEALETFLQRLQRYLRGESVEYGDFASRIQWLDPAQPKVPVDVAATGRKTIEAGARSADLVAFSVGADLGRIRWAKETAEAAGGRHFGAWVIAATDPDLDVARNLVRANVGIFAHFSRGSLGRLGGEDRQVVQQVTERYDTSKHAADTSAQTTAIPDSFVDRFAIVGPPERCAERLRALAALGLERLVVVGASKEADPARAETVRKRFASEVLTALREA